MAARPKQAIPENVDAKTLLATYSKRLKRQPLAQRTRDACLAQVSGFASLLAD